MSHDLDQQFEAYRLESVDATMDPAGWHLRFDGSVGVWCPASQCTETPKPGETVRLYGKGLGYAVRGIIIEGRVYRYLTEAQEKAAHAQWVLDQERQRQEKLDRELPDRDARRAALPEPFRLRVEGFIAARPNFRRDHEGYELFVCEEAAKMAAHFAGDIDGLTRFVRADLEAQKASVPGLKYGEHSGNTWGAACNLARLFLKHPNLVPAQHGALCPLVGCREYGCFAAREHGGEA